jgi:hypothetical protein
MAAKLCLTFTPELRSGMVNIARLPPVGYANDIAESETEPLLGLAMLYGYRLQVDNVEGGIVKIEAL